MGSIKCLLRNVKGNINMSRKNPHSNTPHKYHHVPSGHIMLWACALPDCQHFMPKHYENMLVGKNSICWQCENEFRLDEISMQDDKPICNKCRAQNDGSEELIRMFEDIT